MVWDSHRFGDQECPKQGSGGRGGRRGGVVFAFTTSELPVVGVGLAQCRRGADGRCQPGRHPRGLGAEDSDLGAR